MSIRMFQCAATGLIRRNLQKPIHLQGLRAAITHRKSSTLSIPTIKQAQDLIKSPKKAELQEIIRNLLKNPKQNGQFWPLIDIILQKESYLTTHNRLQLLRIIANSKRSDQVNNSVRIFTSLMKLFELTKVKLSPNDINQSCFNLMASFNVNNDFTQLVHLKALYYTYIHRYCDNKNLELLYLRAYLNSLINAKLHDQAVELYELAVTSLTSSTAERTYKPDEVLQMLPTRRILDIFCLNQDFERLAKWLPFIQNSNYKLLEDVWLKYLNFGLENSNYQIVKVIYDIFIMKGFEEGLTRKDALFTTSEGTDKLLTLVTDDEIMAILHVFSINGDVNLTLQLIESHFVHKTLRGERALTNELCVKVVASYCYNKAVAEDGKDESLKRVLDVLDGFILYFRNNKYQVEISDISAITYQEVTSSLSHKFNNFNLVDENVEHSSRVRLNISDEILNLEENLLRENSVLPRKITNPNIHSSKQGNVLANLQNLRSILEDHINYIKESNYSTETMQIFINCVLNHINLYQNFSGIVLALTTLKFLNKHAVRDWLDDDSMLILLHSLSTSVGSKLSSLTVFKFLQASSKFTLDHKHYLYLIESSDRGEHFQPLFEYYIYKYLLAFNGSTNPELASIVSSTGQYPILLDFISKAPTTEQVDQFWTEHNFNSVEPTIADDDTKYSRRKYNHLVDIRDAESLRHILS